MNISKINTGTLDNREYILMKNRREELITIPKFYITSYTPKLDDVSEMVLEIPNFIEHQGQQIKYPLYDYVQAKRHIVIKKDDQALERFVIESIETSNEKGKKKKKVVARSYENILKNKTCLINKGVTRQLYKPEDETFDVEDGILNMFEQQTGWTVAHIDEQARKEVVESNISVTMDVASENTYEKVEKDTVLLDVDVNVPAEDGFALNFDLSWKDLVITTTDDTSFEAGSIIHTFVDLPCGVTHLKATFTSNAEQRYGMTYELTLTDETVKKVTYAFVNCRNMKLVSKGNSLTYITSQIEEKTVTKYRFLEHSSSFWYQYLKTTIQEAFNCYIFFDSYNKTISVYDKPSKQEWKGFHLDFDNLLTKVTKTQKISDLCTRLWIQSNNVDITEVNPLGTSYIEDYSYFIESGTMSNELKSALERYYVQIELLQEQWLELKKQKDIASQWLTKRNSELVSINEQVKAKNALLTAYIKAGDNEEGQKRVAQELTELENQASAKLAEVDELKEQNDKLATEMQLIGKLMSKEMCEDSQGKIFTTEDLEELTDITIEQTYNDDYHTKAPSLFKYVKELMKDKARLTYDFTLEHKDFVKGIKHPKGWDWFVEVGGRVEIEDKDIADSDGLVTIYSFTYSPKDEKITSVDFSNNSAVIQAVNGLASIGKLVHNTANMTDYWKHTWVEADKATAIVSDIRKNGLDLAANIVRGGSTVNKISMSEAGLFIIDAENENNQIYLGASLMAMTDDKWITSKTAVTTGGVLADSIVGRLILGEKLFISNEDGSFEILPNGLTIRDELGKEQVSLGIDNKKNPFLHLGIKDESKNHLIFNADGTLDIKASSIKLMTGDVVSKEEMEEIANNVANKLDLAIRNYALDTVMHKTLTGNGNNEQVISLYELSQDGTVFMDKEVTLTFKYTTTLESQGSFFVRTGSNHYQALTDVIVIGSETRQGKVAKTVTITKEVGQSFSDLELVARNFTGEITISMLKFSLGNKATDWTPAPEDSDASYSVILTNESQVIPTTTSLKPLSNSQYTTQVIVYQGTKQQTNFKIKPLVAKDGITPSINGDTITFSVNKNTILNANQGQFEIEIEIDNKVFRKMWTWATASQGQDGAIGENAKQVVVTGEQVFKYQNNFTGNPSNLTIRLTATLFHTTGCQWSYRVGSGNPVNISGATNTTLDIQHNASYWGNHKQLVFRCTSNDAIFDEMTVVKVSDGTDGESSYSVFLTNENHSFPCESNGNIPVALETTTNVVVFKGSEKVTPTIGNILKPDGLDVRIGVVNNNEVPLTIIALAGNQLGLGGNIAIPILADGQEFEKSFTYSKAKSGEKGEDGSNAHYITITGEQFFKYGNEGFTGTPTPSQIVLTAQRTNLTGRGEWQYLDGAVWRNLNANTDTLTVTPATGGLAHNSTCSFRFIVDGNYDIMTIAKLSDGANGQDGINGSNAYFYIRYSANADGSSMTSTPQANTKYMGTCSSTSATAPTNASAYSWSLIKGEDGEQGIKGEDGANGESSYLHVKYSNDGRTFTPNNGEDLGNWIGTYVDNNPMDSSVFSDYNWSKFVGEDGQDGQDGASAKFVIMNGEQAFKYTNNFTGNPTPTSITLATTVYNVNNPTYKWSFKRAGETTWNTISGATSGNYSLTHNNSTIFNSNNVKSVTLRCTVNNDIFDEMTIVKVSDGANGTNGKDGINGIDGQDGVSTYFYVRYSANANGSNMTNTPNANSLYMGTCSTTSQVAPTNPTDYQWTLIKGADGKDGIAGANGSDGRTSYLHIKYSNDGQTFTPNNGEDVGLYIGTYVDFVQADSNNFNDYTWKKFVGEDGEDGLDAYTVILTNESHAFPCASNGNVTNAISINTTAIAYKGATSVVPTIGTLPSVNGLTLSKNGAVVTIQANTGTSLADSGTVNIPIVVDGKTFTKVFSWTKAKSGVNGVNGYTILLDNENFTFQASSTGNITSQIQTTTTATAYQGTVQKTPTIGNLPTVNGLTLTKNGATVTIVAKTGTALAEQGEFAIPIIVDNQTFTRKFTWTKARSGAEAQYVVVNGEQVFKYTDNFSGTPTPSSITLTADKINISTNGKWQYKNANGSWTDWTVNNAVVTATTLTVSPNSHLLNSAKQMSVRYIVGTLYDEITIVKVSDGTNGSSGIGIKSIQEQYYLSTSQTTLVGGSWQTTAPKWETGKFIWTKTVFTYTNDMVEETTPICVTGRDGSDGLNGGVSVSNVDVFYYQSNSATSLVGGEWSTNAPTWVNGKYIWSKTITYLDNGKTIESDAICITGQKGQDGSDGKGIKTIVNYYLASSSSSGVTTSTSGWTTEVQSMSASKKYLWNYERVTYTDNSTTNTTPTVIGVFGKDGQNGTNGQDGVGIKSIREYYLATNSASGVTSATSGWTETVQTPTKDKKYLWNYEVIVYTNNTTYTGTPRIIGNFAQDGTNGVSAKSVDIMATSQVFKSKDGGKTFTPNTIKLTPILQNVTYANWQYSTNGGTNWNGFTNSITGWSVANGVLTINKDCSLFTDTVTSVVFKVNTSDSKYYDTMTISRLVDATELEIGTVNRALKTGVEKSFTISSRDNYIINPYWIANDISGRTVTIAFDYEATNVVKGANAIVRFQSAWKDPNDKTQYYPSFEFDLPTGNSKGTIVSEPIEFGNFKDGAQAEFRFRFDYISCGFKIKNARVLVGHKDTGWTPAPEDVEESIGNVNNSLNEFQNTVNTTFKDGIIQESEAKAIKQNLKLLDSTKADVDREYATIYENSLLTGAYKSNLQSAKSSFDSAHNSLKTTINNSISDGKITSSESTSVDNAFNTYNSALGTYRQRVQQALDYLSTAKVNEIEVGGTNLIENSAFNRGNWEAMSSGNWSIVNAESDKPNCKIAKVSRSGATAVSIKNAFSNFTPCLNGETYMFSMDIKVDNFSAWDNRKPFICEVYNANRATRVQFMDVDISMCGLTSMDNGKWYRINYKFKVNHVDAKFIRMRISLFQNGTLYVRCPQIEKGNKASDWSLSPNDIKADIQDVSSELNNFQTNINGAFKDGIIQQAEAKAIEQHLNILDVEKSDIDKEYTTIYGNSLLSGTPKTNLQSAKTSYDSAHASLKSTINTVISDGKVTTSEKASVDSTFNTYRSTLGTYKQRVQEALDWISSAKVDNVQIGGANLAHQTNQGSKNWGWGMQTNNGKTISTERIDGVDVVKFVKDSTDSSGWNYASYSKFARNRIEPSSLYTVSFEVKSNRDMTLNINIMQGDSSNTLIKSTKMISNSVKANDSNWTKIVGVLTTLDSLPSSTAQVIYLTGVRGKANSVHYIRNLKLEKGNKATDWSPSEQDMENAYSIILTNEAQVITTNASRVPTASATYYTDIQVYKGTTQRTDYTIGTVNSANGITVSKTASRVNFAVATNTALSSDNGSFTIPITIDSKTFNKVFSWSCAKQGNNGANGSNGTNGADAYTVILSNENHTFPCENNGNIASAIKATTNVIAYKGATSVTPTIGNLPSVNGLTLSKSGTTVTIQANTGTALASSGSLTIPVTVDGKNFNKVFSWSKAFKGANGASGSNAKSADIVSTSQVFKSTDGGVTFTPDNITLTPILQNVSFSKWQYSTNGGSSWTNVSSGQNGLTISGNNLVISKSSSLYTTSITSVSFKLITNDANIYDTTTVVKLYDVTDLEIGGRNLILDSGKKRGGSTRASEYNINFFKNSKVIVTNPSDSFYSDYPNPPVGGVFNNIKRPINKLNRGNLDAPAITQSALTLIKLYESTGDEECYNRAKLIADYIVSRIYVGSYYGKPMPLMTSRASYKNGAWVNSVGEMTIRNTYQAMYALLRFYQVSNEEIYLTKATDLMKSCGSIYNNINKRVDEGALEEYMRGAVYEYAYDTDGKVTWSWSLVSALSADFLGEAILLYLDVVGNETMLDNEGKSFRPYDILYHFIQHVKNSINAGVFEMTNGTGLPYYFLRNQVGTNWDWVDGTGYGDVWFANDAVLWVIKGLAYIAKKELDNELLEIATRYRNTFFNLKVESSNGELLWHDRYTFNGHALDDDTSVSISATALMYDIDTILGIGRKERNNVQYETTLKNYQIKDQDLNISGSYGWDAMESDSSIEVKATSEIWLSEYYDAIIGQLSGDSDVYNLSEKMVSGKQYTISLTPSSPSVSSYIEINSSRVKLEYKEKTGRACATFVADGQMNLATKIKIMSVGMTYPKLEKGSVATDWSPAPEDGIDYTDKLIDDLRKLDLKQITDQNQESSDMIANILNDSLIMPHEKTSLKFEFERIKILKENAINYYNTVNDTSFQQLRNAMNTAYTNVENMINPILANMTQTSNASNSAVHTTFQTFYTAYETLMTALQQSVIILATKHSTKLEQLDKEITMTASKAEIMQDKVNQFDAHMRFSADGFVEIFATENGQKGRFSTQITNKKLSFKDNEVEVAYVSNQELNINKAVIKDSMKIGKFAIKPSGSSTGGIVFAYEG